MNSPIVLVTRDDRDRQVVSWYETEDGYHNGDPIAEIVAAHHIEAGRFVDVATANKIADTWILLLQVPSYDVSYLVTHTAKDGVLTPIEGRAA